MRIEHGRQEESAAHPNKSHTKEKKKTRFKKNQRQKHTYTSKENIQEIETNNGINPAKIKQLIWMKKMCPANGRSCFSLCPRTQNIL